VALIKCKECGNEVSSTAKTCPKCGARVAAKPMGCGTLIGVVVLAIIIVSTFSSIFSPSADSPARTKSSSSTVNGLAISSPTVPGSQWIYSQSIDPMVKGTTYQARVLSTNIVNFSFPYTGAQRGQLTLRTHPRFGRDVIFSIERGQILCRSYEDCTVLVRFDEEPAAKYSAVGAADNSTETIFIRNYNRFVEKLGKAKRVRVSVDIYQQGAPVFEFDVSDFAPDKYRPKR
jgi:hypothetical protein